MLQAAELILTRLLTAYALQDVRSIKGDGVSKRMTLKFPVAAA